MSASPWCTGPVYLFAAVPSYATSVGNVPSPNYAILPTQVQGRPGRPTGSPSSNSAGTSIPAPPGPIAKVSSGQPSSVNAPGSYGAQRIVNTIQSYFTPVKFNQSWPTSSLPNSNPQGYVPVFLGFSREGVTIQVRKGRQPINTSATGDQPENLMVTAETAMVAGRIVLYDEGVYSALTQGPYNALPRGWQSVFDVGTLMNSYGSGAMHTLYLYFPYALKNAFGGTIPRNLPLPFLPSPLPAVAFSQGQMPQGYRFRNATLVVPERLETGTKARDMDLVWLAIRDEPITDAYGFVLPNAAMGLYDHDMTELSLAVLNSLFQGVQR
jgi:hypothetical protein